MKEKECLVQEIQENHERMLAAAVNNNISRHSGDKVNNKSITKRSLDQSQLESNDEEQCNKKIKIEVEEDDDAKLKKFWDLLNDPFDDD